MSGPMRHQRPEVNALDFRDRMHEVFGGVATHCRDQLVELAVVGIGHVSQNLCKRDENMVAPALRKTVTQ